jgi:hypothetical protein
MFLKIILRIFSHGSFLTTFKNINEYDHRAHMFKLNKIENR